MDDFGEAVALDADGKIVIAGQAYGTNGIRTFALARFTTGGLLDTTFAGDGLVTTDFFNYGSAALDVAVQQTNGKIVAVGLAQGKRSRDLQFALIRYNTDGTLDTSFDNDGLVSTSFSGGAVASGVALYGSGGTNYIVVAGQTQDKNFAVARYFQ